MGCGAAACAARLDCRSAKTANSHSGKTITSYLEIGSFEGRSLLFAASLFPNAALTAIDLLEEWDEQYAGIEARFFANTAPIKDRLTFLRGTSQDQILLLAGNQFDVIYIDGDHSYKAVKSDTRMCWPLLKTGGFMIWDDYLYDNKADSDGIPEQAVDEFLDTHAGSYEVAFVTKEVAISKTRELPRSQ